MQPVYALLESKKLTPEMKPEAVGDGADKAPPAAGKAKDQAKKTGGGSRKSKARRVQYSDDEADCVRARVKQQRRRVLWC